MWVGGLIIGEDFAFEIRWAYIRGLILVHVCVVIRVFTVLYHMKM